MAEFDALPYRPCAGIVLANEDGKVFVGRRIDNPDSEAWQMPQGGIDDGESADMAALRELQEETGVRTELVDMIAQSKEEYFYDLPPELIGKLWQGRWRGQRQYWFLMRFKGSDSDINIQTRHAEFSAWKWSDPSEVPKMIVPFKRHLYERVIAEFYDLI
ncbi:MAG: RNA pyrophosphohydrolase [Sphingomonadales bacterium]|nr:RNA pyrophosphohydrolase [Sphingomonadales bacterium]